MMLLCCSYWQSCESESRMQNDAGEYVDMYIPRKWLVIMSISQHIVQISRRYEIRTV